MALGETLALRLNDRAIRWLIALFLAAQTAWACANFAFAPVTSLPQTWVALYRAAQNTTVRKSTKAATDILLSLKTTHRPRPGCAL